MGFIEDFYFNRLDPQSRSIRPGSKAEGYGEELSDKEERLLGMLPEAEKALFGEIRDVWQDILADNCLDRFVTAFRYGARFAYDAFASSKAPYTDTKK